MTEPSESSSARGNYFARASYIEQDTGTGIVRNRAGARLTALPDDFLIALHATLEAEFGSTAGTVLEATGREWGRQAALQFAHEMEAFRGMPVSETPLAVFATDLAQAFQCHGWGELKFDFTNYATGLLVAEVHQPIVGGSVRPAETPADGLLAGFLAGMFTQFAATPLACLQTECASRGLGPARFVLTTPERLSRIQSSDRGRSHGDYMQELATIRA